MSVREFIIRSGRVAVVALATAGGPAAAVIVAALIAQPRPALAYSCSAFINATCDKDVTVKPGETIVLEKGIAGLRPGTDCAYFVWTVDLMVKPHLGRVTPTQTTGKFPEKDTLGRSAGNCAGRKVNALRIIYHANGDARGKDELELRVRSPEVKFVYVLRYHVTISSP